MNLTKNKWYLALGILLLLAGIFLVVMAFAHLNQPVEKIPWVRLGPMGLMCFIGGVAFLFLPAKIKLK
jgi:drug/metabolite transporter (DMT)-like permease